jgi:hypothetical protein
VVDGGGTAKKLSPQVKDPLKLCPCVGGRWMLLRDRCAAAGIPLTLIETLRQPDRQEHYVQIGVSWTARSKHLPQPPNGLSLAFDAAPTEYLALKNWNTNGPLWDRVAEISGDLGLIWGVWKRNKYQVLENVDKAHHYLDACACPRPKPKEA